MRRRLLAVALAMVAIMSVTTSIAMAQQEEIAVECSDSGALTVRVPPGQWGAAHIVDGDGHFVPFAFSFEVTIDGVLVESDSIVKGGNSHQNQEPKETCTFEETFVEDGHTIIFRGEAEVIRRPA